MINLEISNYSGAYIHLNGNYPLSISRLDLARAMISVGCGGYADICKKGLWGIVGLFSKAFTNTVQTPAGIVLSQHYWNMDASEKRTESYYLGQGFTTLYAQKIHRIRWLLHFDNQIKKFKIHQGVPKHIIGTSHKDVHGPDLVGIVNPATCFLFEAKGYSSGYDNNVMQHALNQLSCVSTFNGHTPKAKVACYFNLSETPIKGIIIDPENHRKGSDMPMNVPKRISQYYSFFAEYKRYFNEKVVIGQRVYRIAPIGIPGFYFGYDTRFLHLNFEDMPIIDQDQHINDIKKIDRFSDVSIGPDGLIVLLDKEKLPLGHYF